MSRKKTRILPSTGTFNIFIPVRPSFGYAESSQKAMENIVTYLRVRNSPPPPPPKQLVEKYFSQLKDAVRCLVYSCIARHVGGTVVCSLRNRMGYLMTRTSECPRKRHELVDFFFFFWQRGQYQIVKDSILH